MKFEVVEEYRELQSIWGFLNVTFFTLVTKSSKPSKVSFILVALCNSIYKVISSMIGNHLKSLLPVLISAKQMCFVEGRHISDAIIIVQKIVHSLKKSNNPSMIVNLDMSKAYDRICWGYLVQVLDAFDFS